MVLFPILFFFIISFIEARVKTVSCFAYLYEYLLNLIIFLAEAKIYPETSLIYELPLFLICFLLPFLFYYVGVIKKKRTAVIFTAVLFVLNAAVYYLYSEKLRVHSVYGDQSEWVERKIKYTSLNVITSENDTANIVLSKGVCIIDFWSRGCAQCLRDMPKLDSFEQNNKNVTVYSFLISHPRNHDKELELLKKYKGKSKHAFILKDLTQVSQLNVEAVPIYFVMANNQIIFSGNLKGVFEFLETQKLM